MTLYSYFHKQPILRSSVLLDEKLVEKLNNSRHHKENIGFWNYFPNYNFEFFDGMIYFQLNRERSKNLIGYLNVLFSDFLIYKDKQQRIKLKLSFHHNFLGLGFAFLYLSTALYVICNSLFQFHFFDIKALLFFVLGAYSLIEFFFHNINSIRLTTIKHFINSKSYEMHNPNEDG
jgi:hypothetical protein